VREIEWHINPARKVLLATTNEAIRVCLLMVSFIANIKRKSEEFVIGGDSADSKPNGPPGPQK
jgi:hypothetical protein